jgi:SET domain
LGPCCPLSLRTSYHIIPLQPSIRIDKVLPFESSSSGCQQYISFAVHIIPTLCSGPILLEEMFLHTHKTSFWRTIIATALLAIGPSYKATSALAAQGGRRPFLSTDSHALLDAARNGIVIRSTRSKGLGAFVGTDASGYKCGDWIGEYTGEVLTRREMETRYWNEKRSRQTVADRRWKRSRIRRKQGMSGDYVFDMEDDLFLDAEDADISGWCRFMNHASEGGKKDDNELCNVETRFSRLSIGENGERTEPRLWFIARRDIESGEEASMKNAIFFSFN